MDQDAALKTADALQRSLVAALRETHLLIALLSPEPVQAQTEYDKPPAADEPPALELEAPWEYERDERGNITGGGPPQPPAIEAPADEAVTNAPPPGYVRPTLAEFVAKGYARDLSPSEQQTHYEAFCDRYEAGLSAAAPLANSAT